MGFFSKWKTRNEDLGRLKEITSAFFEGGFDLYVRELKLEKYVKTAHKVRDFLSRTPIVEAPETPMPVKFRLILERLGPTFIKFGQLLSLRSDLIPSDYAAELKNLQENVPPFDSGEARKIIESELKTPIKTVFRSFTDKPVASASLSQVYVAVLKNGKKVAVKVRRPKTRTLVEQDIRIMFYLAHWIESHYPEYQRFKPLKIVQEFADWTVKELDFRYEGKNFEILRKNFEGSETVVIPRVYWDYATEKVLVMDYVDGVSFNREADLKRLKLKPRTLAVNAADAILTQVFEHGFFHGDPHPGNLFALPGNKVAFLDLGIMGRLNEESRRDLSRFFIALMNEDFDEAVKRVVSLAEVSEKSDLKGFRKELEEIFSMWYNSTLEQYDLVHLFYKSISSGSRYGVDFSPEFVLLSKAFVTMDSTVRELYPKFNLSKEARPYAKRLVEIESSPAMKGKRLLKISKDYAEALEDIPRHVLQVVKRLESGEVNIKVDTHEFTTLTSELYAINAMTTIGMIIAALIISSALIMGLPEQPSFAGYSIARVEFYAAIGLSLWLAYLLLTKER